MREMLLPRIESLEEAHRLAKGPPQTISINFVEGDGAPVEPTVAWTADCSFETFRLDGEDELMFRARANAECCAADPRPLQILIFGDREEEQPRNA
jgi:hypothetical protein